MSDLQKLAFIILLAIVPIIPVSAIFPIHSECGEKGGQKAGERGFSEEGEKIKKKIAILEEELSFLEKEISRDKDIASWGQNLIALRMTRDLLNRDLPEKKMILDNMRSDLGDELKDEIGFIEQNAEKEKEIGTDVRIDIGTIKYTQAYIQENIQRKDDLLKTLKKELEELETKLEKAKAKEKSKEILK
ncbi:MAG: hypothetical protein HY279_00760 [Nitrospinae bacterium]|nr:hypothetical protein [Nitrospinota bacterium]